MSILLQNAVLVQLDPPLVRRGELFVQAQQIRAVADHLQGEAADEVIDCHGAVVMPGLVNGHTHLYAALAPGMPPPPRQPRSFHEILQLIWWRLDRAHNHASIAASGCVGALAALRCGTTTLIDHHASPHAIDGSLDALEDGIREVGCRAVLCYETTERNFTEESARGLQENERYLAKCKTSPTDRFAGLVGAHASFTLGEEALAACVDLCRRTQSGLHLHVAEDPVDEQLTLREFGCGLLARFERHQVLELPNTIFAHGTHLTAQDRAIVDSHRDCISIAHNPSSNMNNGVGYAQVAGWQKSPLLGTDGIGADLWREARTALFKSHDAGHAIGLKRVLDMLASSARAASDALGVRLGTLEPGAAADLVITSYIPATPLTPDNLAAHVVYALGPEYVRSVLIAGTWCLRDGRVCSCDEADMRAASVRVAEQLYERMQPS